MSRWPEDKPVVGETWRSLVWAAGAAIVAGLLIWSPGGRIELPHWRLPEFTMPDLSLPQSAPSAEDQSIQVQEAPNGEAPSSGIAALDDLVPGADEPLSQQSVPFESCIQTIANSARALGQPMLIEDTNERRVAVFKFATGDLTVTCSRADNLMTIRQR